jgi:nucleoside 2-deoxyribosyltransferase
MGRQVKRVYLAGPMSGHPDFNAGLFHAGEVYARDKGWEPVNPHNAKPVHDGDCPAGETFTTGNGTHPYQCWMRADLKLLLDCDGVLMLPGWSRSRGAAMEEQVADICGIPICYMQHSEVPA